MKNTEVVNGKSAAFIPVPDPPIKADAPVAEEATVYILGPAELSVFAAINQSILAAQAAGNSEARGALRVIMTQQKLEGDWNLDLQNGRLVKVKTNGVA